MKQTSIKSFTQLTTWQEGHQLVLQIYDITKSFPKDERYGLVDQLRRASVSITSNIAEGFSRKNQKEKRQFYYLSKGSLTELQNQLLVCRDVEYLKPTDFNFIAKQSIKVHKLLNGLIRSASSKP